MAVIFGLGFIWFMLKKEFMPALRGRVLPFYETTWTFIIRKYHFHLLGIIDGLSAIVVFYFCIPELLRMIGKNKRVRIQFLILFILSLVGCFFLPFDWSSDHAVVYGIITAVAAFFVALFTVFRENIVTELKEIKKYAITEVGKDKLKQLKQRVSKLEEFSMALFFQFFLALGIMKNLVLVIIFLFSALVVYAIFYLFFCVFKP